MKEIERRSFVELSIFGLGSVIGAALAIPAIAYLFGRKTPPPKTPWVEVARVDDIPTTEPREILFERRRVDGWRTLNERTSVWVVKDGSGQVIALAPGCTHLGCAYHWSAENHEFVCPCHASTFAPDGKVTAGPAPRALDRYATRIENGRLKIGEVRRSDT
jgi:menaquinol-cytochrome c reductase iron-sulfur subunit